MLYNIDMLPIASLFGPVTSATEALARLDERLSRSPLRDGWVERAHYLDACASLWVDGELVHVEDLVLHDAHMDVRIPTHELTLAHACLRTRRQIFSNKPSWALSTRGLQTLRGRSEPLLADSAHTKSRDDDLLVTQVEVIDPEQSPASIALAKQLDAMDARLEKTGAVLEKQSGFRRSERDEADDLNLPTPVRQSMSRRDPLIYEEDFDEDAKLAQWQSLLNEAQNLPPVLRAVLALDSWRELGPLQRAPWLGRLLCAALLRQSGLTGAHLVSVNIGLKAVPRERRTSRDQATRLLALVEALRMAATLGLKEHDRMMLAREQLQRRLKGKRSNSKLPALIDLALARPLVTSTLVEKELKVTMQGALNLIAELGLREVTGRGRFRAWGIA